MVPEITPFLSMLSPGGSPAAEKATASPVLGSRNAPDTSNETASPFVLPWSGVTLATSGAWLAEVIANVLAIVLWPSVAVMVTL